MSLEQALNIARSNINCAYDQRESYADDNAAYLAHRTNLGDTLQEYGLEAYASEAYEAYDFWAEDIFEKSVEELRREDVKEWAESFDRLILYIDNHKCEIVERLFGHATPGYQKEWLDRDVFRFWCHLDTANRHRVVRLCKEYYEDMEDARREQEQGI